MCLGFHEHKILYMTEISRGEGVDIVIAVIKKVVDPPLVKRLKYLNPPLESVLKYHASLKETAKFSIFDSVFYIPLSYCSVPLNI